MKALVLLAAAALCAAPADRTYELRGKVEPPPGRWGLVSVSGAYSPYLADRMLGPDGGFKFKKLPAGTYTVIVGVRGIGTVRQTVEVGPSTADSKGRVEIRVPFRPAQAAGALERRNKVAIQDLAIPKEARREYDKARESLRTADHVQAERRLRRALELAPKFAEAWNLLGTVLYQTRRYAEAEGHFREALRLHPDSYAPLVNLGGVLINLKRCQEALEYNVRAVKERPTDALANAQLGTSYYCLQQDGEAIRYLTEAKRLDPRHFTNPQLLLSDIYERRGDTGRAAREIEEYLRLRPGAPNSSALREHLRKLRRE